MLFLLIHIHLISPAHFFCLSVSLILYLAMSAFTLWMIPNAHSTRIDVFYNWILTQQAEFQAELSRCQSECLNNYQYYSVGTILDTILQATSRSIFWGFKEKIYT